MNIRGFETETKSERNAANLPFVKNVTVNNVFNTVQKVKEQSHILCELEQSNQIKIIGGLYNVDTGQVVFFEQV